jgi:hypothetical protein
MVCPSTSASSGGPWSIGCGTRSRRAAVALLDPDLVILDEFQRFRNFQRDDMADDDPDSDAVELARVIFEHRSRKGDRVRVLLLSVTPNSMYTLPANASAEDHEEDFILTTTFLGGADLAASIQARQRQVREAAIGHGDVDAACEAARLVEADLRRVMCRTERLAMSADRDGMLRQMPISLQR